MLTSSCYSTMVERVLSHLTGHTVNQQDKKGKTCRFLAVFSLDGCIQPKWRADTLVVHGLCTNLIKLLRANVYDIIIFTIKKHGANKSAL